MLLIVYSWLPCNRKMLKLCGDTEDKLAQELLQFELQIERDVVEPLYVLAEVKVIQMFSLMHFISQPLPHNY